MSVVQLTADVLSGFQTTLFTAARASYQLIFCGSRTCYALDPPSVLSNAYIGILISIIVTSVGSEIEVMISPIVNSLLNDSGRASWCCFTPHSTAGDRRSSSFSRPCNAFFGNDLWNVLPVFWALIPIFNMINFTRVPLGALEMRASAHPRIHNLSALHSCIHRYDLLRCVRDRHEPVASYFCRSRLRRHEGGRRYSRPCLFAIFMGGRTVYGIFGKSWNLRICLTACCAITVVSYLTAVFAASVAVRCALCGLGVSLLLARRHLACRRTL